MRRLLLPVFACAAASAHAADSGDVRYVPEIFGRIAGVQAYPPTNVCLRHSGSESTQCAYTDMQGRFRIPSFGVVRPQPAGDGEARPATYARYWLEIGTRTTSVTRLHDIGLVDHGRAVLNLECDLSRAGSPRACEAKNPG